MTCIICCAIEFGSVCVNKDLLYTIVFMVINISYAFQILHVLITL